MRRRAEKGAGRRGTSDVTGSDLGKPTPPRLPHGLPAIVQRRAKQVLANAPFLAQCHVPGVVRYVELSLRREALSEELVDGSSTVLNGRGDLVANPVIKLSLDLERALLSAERSLGLNIRGQRENLTAEEQRQLKAPRATTRKPISKDGITLRLA